jgi:general secretion pathway protein C
VNAAAWLEEVKSGHGLPRQLVERGPSLLVGVLLIALALDGAMILTRVLGSSGSPQAAATSPPITAPVHRTVNPTLELASIVNAHLFGAAPLASGGGADAPQTTMPLILAGVIADRDPSRGVAIIGPNAAAAKLYSVGAIVSAGAKLHAVYDNRVLLERNGAIEALLLPRTPLAGGARGAAASAVAPQHTAMTDNSGLFSGLVRIQPVLNQGKLDGYRVFPNGSRGAGAFHQLGLRAGDLIVAVDGTNLDDPARAMEVLQTLSSAGSATVTVSRNGQSQEVNLNLATIANDVDAAGSGQGADAVPAPTPVPSPGPMMRGRTFAPPQGAPSSDGTPSANPGDDANSARDR